MIREEINKLYTEARQELLGNILPFWLNNMVDAKNGGFYGRISGSGETDEKAEKGGILNARILWTFSAVSHALNDPAFIKTATYARDYIFSRFFDTEFGGTFWKLYWDGKPSDTKKQIYSQAFFLYALAAYFRATGDRESLDRAIDLFRLIEEKSFDRERNGYLEAYSRDWKLLDDLRLSAKDDNEKKTTNTHLHILEAYTCLYGVWRDQELADKLRNLVLIFLERIIHPETRHLKLFFDEHWNSRSQLISYGHDIEASWLLYEAARALNDVTLLKKTREACTGMAVAALEGFQDDGSLLYEKDNATGHLDGDRHWWPQAEAVVGLINVYEMTRNDLYLYQAIQCWDYISKNLIDREKGEWFWSIRADGSVNITDDKAGFWKCPYHNARACLEIMHRCESIITR